MRLATRLMIIGIVVVGLTVTGSVTALAQQAGNSSMLVQTNTDIPTLTGSQMSVPTVLANWKGGYHEGWHKRHKGWYGGWYGWGGYPYYYYPYYGRS